ncbi:MAG TPA: hypothetical protein DEB47_17795 [Citreicella sp.]|nr:hypothetical protein [Citreicella sp.]
MKPEPAAVSPLYVELHRWRTLPFVWGRSDCCLCASDWIQRVTGRDPAAAIRELYDSRASCQALTGWMTDPVAAVERQLATIGGLPRVETAQRGDVAVLRLPGQRWAFGAVYLGRHWACRAEGGVTILSPTMVQVAAIWELGYEG